MCIYFGISDHVGNQTVFVGLVGRLSDSAPDSYGIAIPPEIGSYRPGPNAFRFCVDLINLLNGFLQRQNNRCIAPG